MIRWREIHDMSVSAGREIAQIDLSVTNNVPIKWRSARATQPADTRPRPETRSGNKRVYSLNNA
jgi:hypothetical protein